MQTSEDMLMVALASQDGKLHSGRDWYKVVPPKRAEQSDQVCDSHLSAASITERMRSCMQRVETSQQRLQGMSSASVACAPALSWCCFRHVLRRTPTSSTQVQL